MAAGIVVLKRGATSLERRKNSRQTRAGNVVQCRLSSICEVPTSNSGTGCVCGNGNKALTARVFLFNTKNKKQILRNHRKIVKRIITIPSNMCVCVYMQSCAHSEARGGCRVSVSALFPWNCLSLSLD